MWGIPQLWPRIFGFLTLGFGLWVISPAQAQVPIASTRTIAEPPPALIESMSPPMAPVAASEAYEKVLPISLATALQLANARPIDVQIATRQVTLANRQLDTAKLKWVPNLVVGAQMVRHAGREANFTGGVLQTDRNSFGLGIGPAMNFNLSDAYFAPLAARQDLRARQAQRQAVVNDLALSVVEAYFSVQESRGQLAGAILAEGQAHATLKLLSGLPTTEVPALELTRAKVEVAQRQQDVSILREQWRTASAELGRLLRLDPATVFEPVEPAYLPITVIDRNSEIDSLIAIGLTARPELASQQAIVQATLTRLQQEKIRPLVPSLALRGGGTNPNSPIALGGFGAGPNAQVNNFGGRFDIDFQILWEFQALGFGNKARVGEKRAEYEIATLELFRTQDQIAAEISRSYAQAKSAAERMTSTWEAFQQATALMEAATKSLEGSTPLITRPQEVITAIQAYQQANIAFFRSVADYNRGQFRLYRALGHPAQSLSGAVPTVEVAEASPPSEMESPASPSTLIPTLPKPIFFPPTAEPETIPNPRLVPPAPEMLPNPRLIPGRERLPQPRPLPGLEPIPEPRVVPNREVIPGPRQIPPPPMTSPKVPEELPYLNIPPIPILGTAPQQTQRDLLQHLPVTAAMLNSPFSVPTIQTVQYAEPVQWSQPEANVTPNAPPMPPRLPRAEPAKPTVPPQAESLEWKQGGGK